MKHERAINKLVVIFESFPLLFDYEVLVNTGKPDPPDTTLEMLFILRLRVEEVHDVSFSLCWSMILTHAGNGNQ